MAIMTNFHFNQLMVTLIFGIRASEPPRYPHRARRTTKKAGPDRVKMSFFVKCKIDVFRV